MQAAAKARAAEQAPLYRGRAFGNPDRNTRITNGPKEKVLFALNQHVPDPAGAHDLS